MMARLVPVPSTLLRPLLGALASFSLGAIALAAPVELRLIPFDQPEVTVDALEKQRPITNPISTPRGVEMKKIGVDYTGWGRNILLDGKPVFERYYEGKYIDRIPIARPDLAPGKHTIWPGNHVFTVAADGSVSTESPELIAGAGVVKIKCYPVTLSAFLANPDEAEMPMTMRLTPLPNLTLRDSANAEKGAATKPGAKDEALELLPIFDKFVPLTLWLPANTDGKGYLVHPVGLTFHLTAAGVSAGAGGGQSIDGLKVQGSRIEIPVHTFPIVGDGGTKTVITGVEQLQWGDSEDGESKSLVLYPRKEPFEFLITKPGPAISLTTASAPYKSFRVDLPDAAAGSQRALVAELTVRHFAPGDVAPARVRALDVGPAHAANRAADRARQASAVAARDLKAVQTKVAEAEKEWKAAETKEAAAARAVEPVKFKAADEATNLEAANEALRVAQAGTPPNKKTIATATAKLAEVQRAMASAPAVEDPVGDALEAAKVELASARDNTAAAARAVEAAKTGLPALELAMEKAKAAVEAAAQQIEAQSGLNPLEKAPPYAQLQSYGSTDWQDLTVQGGAEGEVRVTLPKASTGVYRLRLGVRSESGPPLFTEQWISIATPQSAGVGFFTQRGRNAFFRGENFWIGLSVLTKSPLPAGTALEVDLVDAQNVRLPLLRESLPAVTQPQTLIVRLDGAQTLSLAAGGYRVEAKVGAQPATPLAVQLVEPEQRTHFVSLLNGKYNQLGASRTGYSQVVKSGRGAEELAAEITAMGYNAFMGMNYEMSRIHRHGLDLEQVVRERPELGPWESYYQPSGRDRFLNAAVRQNLNFYENIFSQHDAMLPRDPQILDACERYTSLEAASMRHSPAFRGVSLYDELYDTGDNDAPRSVVAAFFKGQEMAYRAKHPGLTSADATKALDRFTNRPAGQRKYEDLEKFRTWDRHRDSDWRAFSERMAGAVKAVAPWSKNFTLYRAGGSNGSNIAGHGVPENVFDPLDIAATAMYKDGGSGDRPVFAPMMADILRGREGLPVWTQIHNYHASGLYGPHLFRQTIFGLSQKIEGLTFFTIEHNPEKPEPHDNRDTVRDIADKLLTPYGDFFLSLERGYRKVAVFYSRESAYLGTRKPNKLNDTTEGLWVACLRAGFPADFLYDRQLRDGRGLDYDVIFAPGYTYEDEASPEVLAALKRLVAAGKTVVVERSSKLPIEGIVRLDSELDEYDDKLGGAFPRYVDFETEAVWNQSEETTRLLRDFLSKKIKPAARHNLIAGPDWLKGGQGEYLVLPNFAPTRFTGLHKTLYQAPDQPTLSFPARPPICYDVLEMRRVDAPVKDDWMTLQADLRHLPGKVFAFLPSAIEKVALAATPKLTAGSDLTIEASVANAAGQKIDAAFPLEITVTDAAGKSWLHVFRSAKPTFQMAWRVPVNSPAGVWKLRVRELISGAVTEATVEVSAPAAPTLAAKLDTRTVWVNDEAEVQKFLAAKPAAAGAAEAPAIVIAIDNEQPWCRPQAEKLAADLQARGRAAKVVAVADVLRVVNDWSRETPVLDGGRLWRGELVDPGMFVDAPLILLGKRYENRLIEALSRRDVLPEVISTHFPAPGKAVVGWTRRAFSNAHDTVTVLANDEAGLAAGLAALPTLGGTPAPRGLMQASFQQDAPRSEATAVSKAPTTLRDALSAEDRVRTLDVDAATGRVLVGTFGYGDNLFCFAADGKLLWKQYLPEHNAYFARWFDEGRKVVAATGRGFSVFLIEGESGRVLKKLAATEWPKFHHTYGQSLEGAVNTELQIEVNTPLRQIIIRGRTGLLALDFEGRKLWFNDRAEAITAYPEEAEQSAAATFGQTVDVGDFALSPDGMKLVYSEEILAGSTPGKMPGTKDDLWRHTPKILDARTGQVLLQNNDDPGNQRSPGFWSVSWPADSAEPRVHTQSVSAPLRADNTLGAYIADAGRTLREGGRLLAFPKNLERQDASRRVLWRAGNGTIWLPALDALSADEKRFYRCDREGLVRCFEVATGKVLWSFKLPFHALLKPVGDELLAGANNGTLVRLDATGQPRWQTRLREHHEVPAGDYGEYVAAGRRRDVDSSAEFFPAGQDGPDDYKTVLRMGIEQLSNGGFESAQHWQTEKGAVTTSAPGKDGTSSLQLPPGQLVTQRPTGRVIPSATYLLEFWFRVENPQTRLVAGSLLEGTKQTFTGSKFEARPGEWTFGRLALKTSGDTKTIDVGFEAEGGPVRVDGASLRAVRFPSANLLANAELHAVEQTYVKDIRVQYDRISAPVRDRLMSRNRVSAFAQGVTSTAMIYTQEAAFLQNGKLDDVGDTWTYAPDPMAFAVTLTKPSYVSHLVIYLNNAEPKKVYPVLSILANNLETKVPQSVGLVRMNERRFVVVHFAPPILTDALKIIPSFYAAHTDSLTEVELYGPLDGGKLAQAAPKDADAVPMFMGTPSRVPAKLPGDLIGAWRELGAGFRNTKYPPFASGATVVDGVFSLADPDGSIRSVLLPKDEPVPTKSRAPAGPPRLQAGPVWNLATVTPTTVPARYAGRMLVGSADEKVHAVADNGTYLWSFATGGRVYSSPLPQGDDVFFGSDDHRLYKVDVDSGILIWEFATGDKIRGAPALAGGRVYAASWDGFLYAVEAEAGRLVWKAPVAKFTRATPAVQGDRVFIGDEKGTMFCFDAATGREVWKQELGGYISMCPVVTPEGVVFGSEQGDLALVSLDGIVAWKRALGTEISAQPIATQTQLLVPTEKGLLVLRRTDGQPDDRFQGPASGQKILSVLKWRDQLLVHSGFAWTDFRWPPRTYAESENQSAIWTPAPANPPPAPSK